MGDGEKGSNLAMDMRNILDDPAFADLVLVSKEGHRLLACRSILAARSPVFYAMLKNGITRESYSAEISLPSITACGLLPCLEFIYSGTLSTNVITFNNVIDLIHASRFLLLCQLHDLAIFFLFNHNVSHQHRAMLLSRAVELLAPASDTQIFSHIMTAIPCVPQDLDDLGELSYEAMCFYLETTHNVSICILTSEYSRLRLVLMWCAHSISLHLEEAVKVYMPPEQSEFLNSISFTHSDKDCAHLLLIKSWQSLMKDCFEPFLCYLDLFRVHPHMLARVVEPMGVVPPAYLMHVFRFHAMFSKDMLLLRWGKGAHHPRYVIQEEGSVLENVSNDDLFGFGTTEVPATRTTGVYEWDIVVETSSSYLGIGFCSVEGLAAVESDNKWLGYRSYGWVLCCHGVLYHNNLLNAYIKTSYAPSFSEGSRVRVHIDLSKATCSFTVDGTPCGIAWDNIPSIIYPAVTMCYPGRVRIEFSWTEDKARLLKLLDSACE